MGKEKLATFDDFVPMRSTSVLSLFNLRKLDENQALISAKQVGTEEGGSQELGELERYC